MTIDWRDLVEPCDNVYIYQAALYCDDCATEIMNQLAKAGKPGADPNEPPPEDSDEWPQPASDGGGEADSPNHCDAGEGCEHAVTLPCGSKVGCPLAHELTSEGARYTNEKIAEDLFRKDKHARQVGRLWAVLFRDYLTDDLFKISLQTEVLPEDLVDLLFEIKNKGFRLLPELYLAPEGYIYGGGHGDKADILWRVNVCEEGDFTDYNLVELPAGELDQYPLEDHLKEAISDGAFGD
jgi:hypothetical protein